MVAPGPGGGPHGGGWSVGVRLRLGSEPRPLSAVPATCARGRDPFAGDLMAGDPIAEDPIAEDPAAGDPAPTSSGPGRPRCVADPDRQGRRSGRWGRWGR